MTLNHTLTLYVNPLWRGRGMHTPLLNPWWGNPFSKSSLYTKQLFDAYAFDTNYYSITEDIQMADMVLAPYPHIWLRRHYPALLEECVEVAQKNTLPLLVDGMGDIEYPITYTNTYVLRCSGYRFSRESGRIDVPHFADDLLERCRGGDVSIRPKREENPVVGFAGWARITPAQLLRTLIKELPTRLRGIFDTRYRACTKGVLWRMKAIKLLQRSPLVMFHFRTRTSFSGSAKTARGDMKELQEQMVDTILQSDYALDVRGDANNSARLFEILSLGRIPVIIDTERNFPFSDKVDYSSFALVIDFRDINRLPERIAEFHTNISPERFEQMQRNAREAYVRYFRADAIMRHVVEDLQARMVRY